MKSAALFFTLALVTDLACGCSKPAPERTAEEQRMFDMAVDAKHAVLARLRDPDSVKWGAMWTPGGTVVCGYVNAKNGFGGYNGQTMFVALDRYDAVFEGTADARAFSSFLDRCRNGPKDMIDPGVTGDIAPDRL